MQAVMDWLYGPWPWYVAGPMIGAMVPLMLLIGSRSFGISSNLGHVCAIVQPRIVKVDFFQYDWRISTWNLVFCLGVIVGGFLASVVFANPEPVQLSTAARALFASWGMAQPSGLLPPSCMI